MRVMINDIGHVNLELGRQALIVSVVPGGAIVAGIRAPAVSGETAICIPNRESRLII